MRRLIRRRTLSLGFAARLAIAVAVTFALVGGTGYALMSRQIERRIMTLHIEEQRADASSFTAIGRRAKSGACAVSGGEVRGAAGVARAGRRLSSSASVAGEVRET